MIVNITNRTDFEPEIKEIMQSSFERVAQALKKKGYSYNKMSISFATSTKDDIDWTQQDIDNIFAVVSDAFQLPIEGIMMRNRRGEYVNARQLIYEAMRYGLRMNLKTIGNYFGYDHSSIIHNLGVIKDRMFLRDIESLDYQRKRKHIMERLNNEYGIIYK